MAFNIDIKPFQNFFSLGVRFLSSYAEFYFVYIFGQVTSQEGVTCPFFIQKYKEGRKAHV
uniref:hypothetical protein n=1 Tax=Listeria seeligeri TaxID=1640 RepID=UPI0010E7BF2C|nr:hypothetical protein [Listeria seeligeri]